MTLIQVFLLLGGIAMFLYGMNVMSDGFKRVAGDNLRVILEHATKNTFLGILLGTAVTMIIQSSGATMVMCIGFVNTNLMTLIQALSVIMGANIGTTVTSQIIAFDFGSFAPFILFIGAVMFLFFKKKTAKNIGMIVLGFGLLFIGISTMGDAIEPLKSSEEFTSVLTKISNPFLGVLIGILFTAIVQSSSSSIGIMQAFALRGLIDPRFAVYLVIGAAIGACVPPLLAAFSSTRDGKRAALLCLIFNIIRAVICFIPIYFFPGITEAVIRLSPNDPARQIANMHVFMVLFAVLLEAPFAKYLVALSIKLVPITEAEQSKVERKLLYINQNLNVPTAIALSQARREICRMGHIAENNLELSLEAFFEKNLDKITQVSETEETLNYLNHAITSAIVSMQTSSMTEHEKEEIAMMLLTVSDIERIGDHAENISEYASVVVTQNIAFSEAAQSELLEIADNTVQAIALGLGIFEDEKHDQLAIAEDLEDFIDKLKEQSIAHHLDRLMNATCNPHSALIFSDMVTDLERCADHANNIANSIEGRKDT